MHAFPRSSVLVFESSSAVSAIIPSTLVDQVDALLDDHRIDDAALLVDQRRKKLEANLTVDPDEAEELDYAYQVIGFKCFSETLFDDAGRNLFNGHLDPRILVSYFPDLRGALFVGVNETDVQDQVDVFSGVAERMPQAKDIDELIKLNLVLNYSPHLSPTSPPSLELTRVLKTAANDMLCLFLEKSRKRARVEGIVGRNIPHVVDTVLAKLYATSSSLPTQLSQLISEPNHIHLPELEPLLLSLSLYNPLISLYKHHKQTDKLLDLYASSPEGVDNPIEAIHELLTSAPTTTTTTTKKREEHVKWGLWMLHRGEIVKGLKLLIPPDTQSSKRLPPKSKYKPPSSNDLELLAKVTEANEEAGKRFLEYLVLRKGYTDEQLHTRLALNCIEEIGRWLEDESVCKLWRAKVASYASPRSYRPSAVATSPSPSTSSPTINPPLPAPSPPLPPPSPLIPSSSSSHTPPTQQPFLTYFSSTTPDTPSKRARLKCIFVLAGSAVYDAQVVLGKILALCSSVSGPGTKENKESQLQQILALELTILYGKLGNHATALQTLVYTLRDSASAEMYCNLGGEIVPARMAHSIAATSSASSSASSGDDVEMGMTEWYNGLFESPTLTGSSATVRQKSVKEDVKKGLLTDLIGVYVHDSLNGMGYTKAVLDRQGVNLDVVDVVTLVPDDWSLNSFDTFLSRHFRRTLHSSYENVILKNLSAGQNLVVRERSWPIIRSHGYVIEEPDSEDDDVDGGEDSYYNEKEAAGREAQRQLEQVLVGEKVAAVLEKSYGDEEEEEEEMTAVATTGEPERVDIRVVDESRSALGLILDGGDEEREQGGSVSSEVEIGAGEGDS